MKKRFLILSLACGSLLLHACGGGSAGGNGGTSVTTHFSVTAPATATVGTVVNVTVTALDASNNTVTTYSGTVHFTSTDGQAVLPVNSTLTNGAGNFSVTLKTAGSQTITATDTVTASIAGTSNSIKISVASAAKNPVPLVYEPLSPAAALPGGPGFTLTVNGSGFVSGSAVHWNGSARITTFISNSKLMAEVLAADIANFRTASVTVVNPGPGGGTSNVVFFETTRPTSAIALTTPAAFAIGSSPVSVATGDFNSDGKLDLVVANMFTNNVSMLLGNGDGTFQIHVDYATDTAPAFVAVGDFDGDGKLDLAVANSSSNNISILLGNGDGTFQAAVNYVAGSSPFSIALGDFNKDGNLDMAVANQGSSNVSVLLGRGDGTFRPAVNYSAGSGPSFMAVGDFNSDGKLDLAVANTGSDNVSVLLGNGDGTFQLPSNYNSGAGPRSLTLGDFNGDGNLDLAMANQGGNNVSVLLGNGNGTFRPAVSYDVGSTPTSLVTGDFNGDGKLDLAVANIQSGNVSILLGLGDGTFQTASNYGSGLSPVGVAAGDFNGDGRLDLAVIQSQGTMGWILLQPGLVSGPNATWSFPSLSFGVRAIDTTSAAQSITLVNYGTALVDITSIVASANFGDTHNCGSSLASGASCAVQVTFSPSTAAEGNGTLSAFDDAPSSPQIVSLVGSSVSGFCEFDANNITHRLTGNCILPGVAGVRPSCFSLPAPSKCPAGAPPIQPHFRLCLFAVVGIDTGRICP
jgi:hypothetical protein